MSVPLRHPLDLQILHETIPGFAPAPTRQGTGHRSITSITSIHIAAALRLVLVGKKAWALAVADGKPWRLTQDQWESLLWIVMIVHASWEATG